MIAARSPGRLRRVEHKRLHGHAWPLGAHFFPAQGSIHRALPFQERVSSRKVGPAGRRRLAGLTAPAFALLARLSFSLASRASSEQAARGGSVVSRAAQPSAFVYRKILVLSSALA